MMFLSRLLILKNRAGMNWLSNPYRVHQRLCMAGEGDPRLLFRIEETDAQNSILVQTRLLPDWQRGFRDLPVLAVPPEVKEVNLALAQGQRCRFRLLANPTLKREGRRLGLLQDHQQRAWLERKLAEVGAVPLGFWVVNRGLRQSEKNPLKETQAQVHVAVLFEGVLEVKAPQALVNGVLAGIGAAKGYGFGLLSLARA
jgi:CRISPR system Cascade subunit CasE